MCSSKLSVNCEKAEKDTQRSPDCRSPIFAGLSNKENWSPKRIVLVSSAHGAGTRFSGVRANLGVSAVGTPAKG